MQEATRIIRASLTPATPGAPLHAGPVFTAPFHVPGDPAETQYTYGRSHNPTWTELEHLIGLLEVAVDREPAGTRSFASGLAAVAAVFGAVLRPGDTVLLPANCYFAARQILQELFVPIGVTLRLITAEDFLNPASYTGVTLVWLETPGNPSLDIVDMAAVATLAHAAGALLAVDNTTATPLGQRPLALGADFSVCSDSKAMCGHSDIMLGHVSTLDGALLAKIDRQRTLTGGIPGPMEAWLASRSLLTLPLRLERMSSNALALARFLAGHSAVVDVRYCGLPTHPNHAVAASQMLHFGPVLSFTLASQQHAEQFLAVTKLFTNATSFGGITSSAERRARWGHDSIAAGFIRMSAGCEAREDLIADLSQALDALP